MKVWKGAWNSLKKIICLIMILCLAVSAASAMADKKGVDGTETRDIQINPAGDNPVEEGVSPTTGRKLEEVKAEAPEGATGLAITGRYMPAMVQIQNGQKGVGSYAPLYGACADVIYQTPLSTTGHDRMSMIFSDVIPPYVGFVRSTRVTHLRVRQEWDCAYITSGWSDADVPDEMKRLGYKNPMKSIMTDADPGFVYPGDAGARPWVPYVRRMTGSGVPSAPDNEVFELAELINNVTPADYLPRSRAFRFTDEKPQGEDAAFIYVTMTSEDNIASDNDTYSELEYDEETNTYFRYVFKSGTAVAYHENIPVNLQKVVVNNAKRFKVDGLEVGREIDFSNVIVQCVDYEWPGGERPYPTLVGTGNADYFMGGKHIAGVWHREDDNSRTVYYGPDGNEIELQRGRTLIILLDYKHHGHVEYE